ncbi:MAG: pseudouridine synthase, partial [bacterium]
MAGRNRTIVTVDASHEGSRLDKVVQSVVPDVGLREARRMIREGLVRVDGLPGAKGDRMRQGQQLEIREPLTGRSPETFTIVTVQAGLAALEKPAGVHSQSLGRTRDLGVDASLAALFPGQDPVLLNRLDQDTSGLLIAALTREAETTWHVSQDKGEIEKFYLTLVRGRLAEPVAIKNQINSAHR